MRAIRRSPQTVWSLAECWRICGTDGPPWLSQTVRRDLSEPVEFSPGTGDVIEERVQVVNPKERHYVAVVVPLAAGVEVMNPALATAPPDLLLSRHAPPWIVGGGGHFALIAGGCLSLLPAGQASDRWSARRLLVFSNLTTALALGILLLRDSTSPLELLVVMAVGAFNGVNNIAAVAEGNRLLPGQASAVSALLMGVPWCIAALGPVVAGVLADPARGETPAGALGWSMLLMPIGLAAAVRVRSRGPSPAR